MRCAVFYVQEVKFLRSDGSISIVRFLQLPGLNFMDGMNLHQMILRRAYDWFLLKYYLLLNRNGQSYFLDVHGFRYTRRWLNFFYGTEMANAMFDFAQSMRDLRLNDRERSLILPLRLCQPGRFAFSFREGSDDTRHLFAFSALRRSNGR